MKRVFLFFLFFLFLLIISINEVRAYELIYPKEKKSYVTSNYALFMGKAKKTESIIINDEKIYIAPNGAFTHSIKLKEGENRFIVKSNFNTKVYRFYKSLPITACQPELLEFEPKLYEVKNDNTPLRATPLDYGMNRLSHLFEGTNLLINGQKGNFYRVFLSENDIAWIEKDSVCEKKSFIEPKFIFTNNEIYKNASKLIIEFSEKLPYIVSETDSEIFFKVYNPLQSKESVYTLNFKKPTKYFYKTSLEKGKYIFKVVELPSIENNLYENLTIVIDAGHGGSEKGAIGCLGDNEKDINLKIANELKLQLSSIGINAMLTRPCDGNMSLNERVEFAKKNNANIFISIHLNSIPDVKFNLHKHQGTSVYYYNQNSKILAYTLKKTLVNKLKTRDDGVKTASFAVIRPTEYIGVLLEVAYMTNPQDSVLYTKESFATEVAEAITEGVLNFIKE